VALFEFFAGPGRPYQALFEFSPKTIWFKT
jgi:hypothetical protein